MFGVKRVRKNRQTHVWASDADNLWTKRLIGCAFCMVAFVSPAKIDAPDISGWTGTAYHTNGWFTYTIDSKDGAIQIDSGNDFVLSPHYSGIIRRIEVEASRTKGENTKSPTIYPFINGVEQTESKIAIAEDDGQAVDGDGSYKSYIWDFSQYVDAFRFGLTGSGSSITWAVRKIIVYLSSILATPTNLQVKDSTKTSLSLSADVVEGAENYRFLVEQIDGIPVAESREDFINAPELSDGWTYGLRNNVSLDKYTGTSTPDNKTQSQEDIDAGGVALKIDSGKGDEDVQVEILSPMLPAAVSECSYVCKQTSSGGPDVITVYGRSDESADWIQIAAPSNASTSKTWRTNTVDLALNIHQVKFEFCAKKSESKPCGLDTLRVVYGGEFIGQIFDCTNAVPTCSLSSLETARYKFKVQALGDGEDVVDSQWSSEQEIDLKQSRSVSGYILMIR